MAAQKAFNGGLCVHADPTLFSTIIRNLFSNAVKFTSDGGTIRISGVVNGENGGRAIIRVIDTGIGIDAVSLKKLFTLDNKSAIKFGIAGESGSGLSFLICRDFVKLMGAPSPLLANRAQAAY
ncbi:MAG TPA: ATP-binding protein [Candidatus Wallbacteria bacterium]|nr:MAG: Sensor protein EvgS precursor [bacterium ADurb.Bin243]HOD42957.1 ATP-binding protein [Candidatus Wallbacteria bacterium]HPG58413.1 ATP-binding protein [Candidatus Wallbacteria bacterium]